MRNLKNVPEAQLEEQPKLRRIPRQVRPLTEREFNRHIREAGRKERTILLATARAMKAQEVEV